ncbi:MAG: CPBP family glutamic-type intramembrane protease [Anaerolineae bacterium]
MSASPPIEPRHPSVRGVNLVLLISMVLYLSLGLLLQSWSVVWGTIITEILLILPALIYLLIARLPMRQTLQLRWPGWNLVLLTLFLATGMWIIAIWWGTLAGKVIGYNLPVPPDFYPREPGAMLLLMSALALFAPVCEEVLFRGILLRGYERSGAVRAILASGLIFAGFHLSPLRFVALLPMAMMLGFIAWRCRSLILAIILHAVYNGISGGISLLSGLRPDLPLERSLLTPLTLAAGVILVVASVVGLLRLSGVRPAPLERDKRRWLGRNWPLIPVVLVMVILMAAEALVSTQPQTLALNRLALSAEPAPGTFGYELRTITEEHVGDAQVELQRQGQGWLLDVRVQRNAFEAQQANSYFKQDAMSSTAHYTYDASGLNLLSAGGSLTETQRQRQFDLSSVDGDLQLEVTDTTTTTQKVLLPYDSLFYGEWPWRLTALNYTSLAAWQVDLGGPSRPGINGPERSAGTDAQTLLVFGAEPLAVPAGNFIAWRVKLGQQTAWYDVDAPHILLRYDDGVISYRLSSR